MRYHLYPEGRGKRVSIVEINSRLLSVRVQLVPQETWVMGSGWALLLAGAAELAAPFLAWDVESPLAPVELVAHRFSPWVVESHAAPVELAVHPLRKSATFSLQHPAISWVEWPTGQPAGLPLASWSPQMCPVSLGTL